jgi:hypothetical protein
MSLILWDFVWALLTLCFCFLFTDWNGVKYTCLQLWFHFCLDYFSFSCCLYCFHFGCNTGAKLYSVITSVVLGCFHICSIYAMVSFLWCITRIPHCCLFSLWQWRTQFRQAMNKADNASSTVAVDSLLNYEVIPWLFITLVSGPLF